MTLPAPTYDLVLLLDPQADESVRMKLIADTRATIEGQGELLRHDDWGERALAYPIERKASAEYHLLQFHIETTELLKTLDRTLRLADVVVRFRIVKLAPGVAAPPDMAPAASAPRRAEAEPAASEPAAAEPAPSQPASAEAADVEDQTTDAGADAAPSPEVAVGDAS